MIDDACYATHYERGESYACVMRRYHSGPHTNGAGQQWMIGDPPPNQAALDFDAEPATVDVAPTGEVA